MLRSIFKRIFRNKKKNIYGNPIFGHHCFNDPVYRSAEFPKLEYQGLIDDLTAMVKFKEGEKL